MAYEKQNFSDGNPLYADQLNHIEQGIIDAENQIPQKTSDLANDSGYITDFTETDPTVPNWAKQKNKPGYTAAEVGADPAGTAADAVADHNTSENSHTDIRLVLQALTTKLNNFLDSDDTTLDELSELITAIKANAGTISQLTSGKVNVADIVNNLTTNVTNKPLSAAQGVALKKLIDALNTSLANYQPKGDYALKSEIPSVPVQSVNGKTGAVTLGASDVGALPSTTTIPSKTSQLTNDSGFITGYTETDPTVPSWAKAEKKPTYTAAEVGALPSTTKIPSKTSELTNDSGYLTESETRDIISELIGTDGDIVDIPLTNQGYMGGGDGWWNITDRSEARNSGYVEIPSGYKYVKARLNINQYGWAVIFSTANGSGHIVDSTISVLGQNQNNIYDYFVEIPENAKYVFVSTFTYSADDYAQFVKEETADNSPDKAFENSEFALFRQWGIVGDSLSVGHTADGDGNASNPHYYYSWGQYLARRIGNTCLNIGRSGQSAKSFMTDAQGYNLLIKPEMLCQCYILALGANDTSMTLGSIADVDFTNMNNNADTEYGWYAKVINAIRTTAPQAPIFLFTLPYPRNDVAAVQAINEMIREFASNENFSMVYLVDLDANYDDYFRTGKLSNCIGNTGWHLTALGYLYASIVNEMAISKVMSEHPGDFQNVFKIPYGTAESEGTTTTTENWVFELEDGSTVTKAVVIG